MRLKTKSNKKVYRQVKQSKVVGIGSDRPFVGFAYAITPNDIDRDEYLREFYRTGLCMIITDFNEPIRKVKVPNDLIADIKFPHEAGEYGSMLSWNSIPNTNQVVVTGIYLKPGEFYPYKENVYVEERYVQGDEGNATISVTSDLNIKSRIVSLTNDDGSEGLISFIAKSELGTSKFNLYCDGTALLELDDKIDLIVENEINIQIGTSEEDISTLKITKDGTLEYIDKFDNYVRIVEGELQIESTLIKIGDEAEEAAILGDSLKSIKERILQGIQQLTVPTAMGPSGVPINSATFAAIEQELDTILSQKVKIE